MFGLSFGELCMIIIVAIVVIGPKDMPKMLRKAGQLASRLRKMANDARAQSGIDEVLRADGLHDDINEIRKLAQADFLAPVARPASAPVTVRPDDPAARLEREYPREGADAYGSLPDTAVLYAGAHARSALASDALYVTGDPLGVIPDPPAPEPAPPPAPDGAPAPALSPAPESPGAAS